MSLHGFGELACGSNGGPPRQKLEDWSDFAKCRVEESSLHEVYARFDDEDDGAIDARSHAYQRLVREALEAQRAEIIRLRNVGKINDEIMHRIERDLDLEDTRLEV